MRKPIENCAIEVALFLCERVCRGVSNQDFRLDSSHFDGLPWKMNGPRYLDSSEVCILC